jgi:hypothetical protein
MKRQTPVKTLAVAGAALSGALSGERAEALPIFSDPPDVALVPGQGSIHLNLSNLLNPGYKLPDAVINYGNGNTNLGFQSLNNLAAAIPGPLNLNAAIGPNNNFVENFTLGEINLSGRAGGPWVGLTNAFLGLMVDVPGSSPHFGWARLSVDENLGIVLHDFALESEPNTPIAAGAGLAVPEPGSLGLLALGAVGLAAWRKRRARS